MGEMEDKIQKLLSSEEGMKTVMSLASAIMSGQGAKPSETATGTQENTNSKEALKEPASNDPDLAKLQETFSKIMGENGKSGASAPNEDRLNLLTALKPFLNSGRQGSIDRAARMVKTAKVAKSALEGFRGGNGIV